jgi:hypothetical protein
VKIYFKNLIFLFSFFDQKTKLNIKFLQHDPDHNLALLTGTPIALASLFP